MKTDIKRWFTLLGFCLCTFANGLSFGVFSVNLQTFADYFYVSAQLIDLVFYIGLIVQAFGCLPIIKVLQWRLDFAIFMGAFFTAVSNWILVIGQRSYYLLIASQFVASFGQLIFLPTNLYLSQRWFPLQLRSVAIGISFYSNLLGFSGGAILCSTYIGTDNSHVYAGFLSISIVTTGILLIAILITRNKPEIEIQNQQKIQCKQLKNLWKFKFNTYVIIVSSIFLGVSWTFLNTDWSFNGQFNNWQNASFISIWYIVGTLVGISMSIIVNAVAKKTGQLKIYDIFAKIILFVGVASYFLLGTLSYLEIYIYPLYMVIFSLIGAGTLGYYGVIFLSLIETMHPIPSLMIGTLIAFSASLYSALINAMVNFIKNVDPFFLMGAATFLPFVYLAIIYRTKFKRYHYYLSEKQCKFKLLAINYEQELQVIKKNNTQNTKPTDKIEQ